MWLLLTCNKPRNVNSKYLHLFAGKCKGQMENNYLLNLNINICCSRCWSFRSEILITYICASSLFVERSHWKNLLRINLCCTTTNSRLWSIETRFNSSHAILCMILSCNPPDNFDCYIWGDRKSRLHSTFTPIPKWREAHFLFVHRRSIHILPVIARKTFNLNKRSFIIEALCHKVGWSYWRFWLIVAIKDNADG